MKEGIDLYVIVISYSLSAFLLFHFLFLQFGIRSAVLNSELPQNSRLHILEVRQYSNILLLQSGHIS